MKLILSTVLLFSLNEIFCQELSLEDGIYSKNPVFQDTSAHRYSLDNRTFKIKKVFTYDYYFEDSSSVKKKFLKDDLEHPENSTTCDADHGSLPPNAIDLINLTVTDNPESVLRADTSSTQTIIRYEYFDRAGKVISSEETGAIDNKMNIWLHPPRSHYFKILELSPYPFVYIPGSLREWRWTLQVGPYWGDNRWIEWKGAIHIEFNYKRLKPEYIMTKFGLLACQVTDAIASSEVGKASLKSYFHPYYGFVRIEYTNINSTKLVLELISIKD